MPGDSKRNGSPPKGQSAEQSARQGPRTRSMAHKEAKRASHSPGHGEGGATGSEVNNEGGGSPSSNESPSPVQRKKPRRVTMTEISEERDATSTLPSTATETHSALTERDSAEEDRVVSYFTQYLCLSLWRAVENCEVWDHRLIKAFCEGPRSFAAKMGGIAQNLHGRLSSTGRTVRPEDVSESYLKMFRPHGLYNCCARILQGTMKGYRSRLRSLKRKKPEPEPEGEMERYSMFKEEDESIKKYKHRFLMDPPRLIVLSGPEKTGFDEEVMTD